MAHTVMLSSIIGCGFGARRCIFPASAAGSAADLGRCGRGRHEAEGVDPQEIAFELVGGG